MKIKLLSLAVLLSFSNSNSMENAIPVSNTKPKLTLLPPLKPKNIDILSASIFIKEHPHPELLPDLLTDVMSALVESKLGDDESNKSILQNNSLRINSLMTIFSFEENNNSNKLDEFATPKINKLYVKHVFPKLIDTICKTEPQDLVKKMAWQILNTMPNLYDTFDSKGGIEGSLTNGKQLDAYRNLIIKVAQTDFAEQDILLTRLIKNWGTDIDFLNFMDEKISEHEIFVKQIENVSNEDLFKNDYMHEIIKPINLIHNKFEEIKHEIEIENFNKRIEKLVKIKNLNLSDSNKNENKSTEKEEESDEN